MKVWITRDNEGDIIVWEETADLVKVDGEWHLKNEDKDFDDQCVSCDDCIERYYGKGFFGVKKGARKLFDVVLNPA